MFNSHDDPGAGSDVITHRDRPRWPFEVGRRRSGRVTSVDLCSLPAGTELVVDTRNSRYWFVMLDDGGCNVRVQGGYFRQATLARIDGSTLGGYLLKRGWIGLGFFVKMTVRDKRIVTSRVHSIRVERL